VKLVLSHVAMIAGMAALMVCRWDRYTHGTHGRTTTTEEAQNYEAPANRA
jgi:hypothetical protein